MSGPFPERLSRFTPDAGTLDPAAVLYAAGRRSARPNRLWVALAAALAGSQALSLALLLVHPAPPAAPPSRPVASVHPAPAAPELATAPVPDSPGVWSVLDGLDGSEPVDRPAAPGAATMVDGAPPLRGFGPPPPSLVN
jgi:hypothetical protein